MLTRRDLLKGIGIGAAVGVVPARVVSGRVVSGVSAGDPGRRGVRPPRGTKPVVVSTWKFGMDANKAAWEILAKNGRALDAVEAGARVPEADPTNQSVGLGGLPDRDGIVSLDACVMDEHGNAGSVGELENIVHAVSVARRVMEKTPHVMLVGPGALEFALAEGFQKENLLTESSRKAWEKWKAEHQYSPKAWPDPIGHDTIGILALDANGDLSGACTTSGISWKYHGRVGDSPIIGAGLFVDNDIGAACSTGLGEANMRICGSHTVVEAMRHGATPQEACEEAVRRIVKKQPNYHDFQVAFLALNKNGEAGAFAIQKGFEYAMTTPAEATLVPGEYFVKG